MPTRTSSAKWEGSLKGGKGTFSGESGAIGGQYNFSSRFEEGVGSNPEELLAAAEAACYSMALAGDLEKEHGKVPTSVDTVARCTVEPVEGRSTITKIHLVVNAVVPGIDDAKFQEVAKGTLAGCPVSRTFKGNVDITLEASLQS